MFDLLEQVAWTAFQQRQLLFSFDKGKMEELYCQYPPTQETEELFFQMCTSGFVQSTGDHEEFLSNEYSFMHLTFQEFLAARYLARLIQENEVQGMKLIRQVKFDPRYKVVMWFVAGLLKEDPKRLSAFFNALDTPKDVIGLYAACLKIRCLEECGWSTYLKNIDTYEREIGFWCRLIGAKRIHESIQEFLVEAFKVSPQGARRLFMPILSLCVKGGNFSERVIECIGQVGQADLLLTFSLLEQCLKSRDDHNRFIAVEACGIFGLTSPERVISLLEESLKNGDSFVRKSAAKVLRGLVEGNRERVVPLLEGVGKDISDILREETERLKMKYGTPSVYTISKLERLFKSNFCIERNAAVARLEEVFELNQERVISMLEEATKDKDRTVRYSAAKVLGGVIARSLERVIPLLELCLKDEFEMVRKEAAKALGRVVDRDPERVIPLLELCIKDRSVGDREAAIKALGRVVDRYPERVSPLLELCLMDDFTAAVAAESLGKYNLSSLTKIQICCLQVVYEQRRCFRPFLSSTPLSSLLRNYEICPSGSLAGLSIIVTKCLEENLAISMENDVLIFYEKGESFALNFSNPQGFVDALEKHVHKYPHFGKFDL